MPEITLPDKSKRKFDNSISVEDLAKDIGPGLAKSTIAGRVNGVVVDASEIITQDAQVEIITSKDPEGIEIVRHSCAHLLAHALKQMYPEVKLAIGPVIDNGFYYDILLEKSLNDDDLQAIEDLMLKLAKKDYKVVREVVSRKEAVKTFKDRGEPYKVTLAQEIPEKEIIALYHHEEYTDMCRGPHVTNTKHLRAFKLTKVSGAYWRGDSKNEMLQRIYGTGWATQKELDLYLQRIEEAEKRDHRKIGKEMELFTFSKKVGQGLPLWLPKGAQLREKLENFLKKAQENAGYLPVITPHIGNKDLYVCSGHYDKYGEDSFQPIKTPQENEEFYLKPMNCPHHCEVYKSKQYSYKDLPVRFAEFGTVYRYEKSGELHGLTRVRGFTQDDAHLFVRPDQVKSEFINVIDLVLYVFRALDFKDFKVQISLRDKENKSKYIGSEENWEKAEQEIIEATKERNINTVIEYGEAAFYGPKLDFMVKDAIGSCLLYTSPSPRD
mgnify:CR=1 FL=1